MSLLSELEAAKGQINNFDIDYGKATDNMKMSMTTASIERNNAVTELKRLRHELNDTEVERDRVGQKLTEGIDGRWSEI